MNLCYLGNSPQEYTEYRKAYPQAETVFLCTNYLMVRRLQENNEQAHVYDDHVPTDQSWAAFKWLSPLLKNWFLDSEGNDLSMFGEVSLGTVSQTSFARRSLDAMRRVLSVRCGVALYYPQVLAWGESLGEDWRSTCAHLAATLGLTPHPIQDSEPKDEHLPQKLAPYPYEGQVGGNAEKISFRLWQWFTSKYAWVQDTISNKRAGQPHDILCLCYTPLDPVWTEWNNNREIRKRIRLGFLSNNPPRKSAAIRALSHRCAVYPIKSQSMHPDENSEVETITGKLNRLMESEDWRRRLIWDGMDLSPILTPLFRDGVAVSFPISASWAVSLKAAILRRKPRATILPYTDPVIPQVLRQLAAKHRFKTVYIPHGYEVTTQPDTRNIYGNSLDVDRIVAISETDLDAYSSSGASPGTAVAMGFFPAERAIEFARTKSSLKQSGKNPGQKSTRRDGHVLVLDHGRMSYPYFKERTVEEFFFNVLEILTRLGYRQITYKLHPGVIQMVYYEQLKRYLDPDIEVTIVKDESIFELMSQAEFIVGPITSGIFEAAVLDTPYLCAHFEGLPLWPPLDTADVPIAHDYASLKKMIVNYQDIWPAARRSLLRDGCGLDPDDPLNGTSLPQKLFDDLSTWLDADQLHGIPEPQLR